MADKSAIEWTDATWNPIRARNKKTGKIGWFCVHASEGCRHCFSARQNVKAGDSGGNGIPYRAQDLRLVDIFLDEKVLTKPLHWRAARKIFVCSMTDLFADFVPDEWIDKMFAVMALCPQHTFQVLTKRAERMQNYVLQKRSPDAVDALMNQFAPTHWCKRELDDYNGWPLPNVWLGVSCERQEEADTRIPLLLRTPAAVRFVSAEPLLGPIRLDWVAMRERGGNALSPLEDGPRLDWVIAGGESGSQARPMHPQWARGLRDQCQAAGLPYFFKQWGEWLGCESTGNNEPPGIPKNTYRRCDDGTFHWPPIRDSHSFDHPTDKWSGHFAAKRVGKKAAGRLLDGREWNEFPEAR